jgi:ferric iron reductase protein FhuF
LSALLGSPELLVERVAAVRLALGGDAVERRAAASVAHLGLTARLVSPLVGAAVLGQQVLRLDPEAVWWRPVLGGPLPLAARVSVLEGVPYAIDLAAALASELSTGPVGALVELTATLSVSRQVLWGNVASAVNGAVATVVRARPDLAAVAVGLGQQLLSGPLLTRTSTGRVAAGFRRRSCCLIYRVSPGKPQPACGDCILNHKGVT